MSRIEEIMKIMSDVRALGFPLGYPPMKELSLRMSDYIKTGDPWSGKIKFELYSRVADIILPRNPKIPIQVVFRYQKF